MSVFYYDPFSDFERLFDEAFTARTGNNNQVQRASNDNAVTSARFLRPTWVQPSLQYALCLADILSSFYRMDLHDDKETNTITATFELPGVKKEDVQIDVQNNRLTIGAESNFSSEENKEEYVVKERRFGKFSRTLQLPQGVKVINGVRI